MLYHFTLLYHLPSLVSNNETTKIILAAAVCSTSAFACSCTSQSHAPAATFLWFASWFAAKVNHLITTYRYGGKRHKLGYQIVIQVCPTHGFCKLQKMEGVLDQISNLEKAVNNIQYTIYVDKRGHWSCGEERGTKRGEDQKSRRPNSLSGGLQ